MTRQHATAAPSAPTIGHPPPAAPSGVRPWELALARGAMRVRLDLPLAALDGALVAGSYLAATVVRFDGAVPDVQRRVLPFFLVFAVIVHLAAHWTWALYGQVWLHASVQEARRVVLAGMTATALLAVVVLPGPHEVPLSVLLGGAGLGTALAGAVRFQSRLFGVRRAGRDGETTRVVLLGAGESGGTIVREMLRFPEQGLLPVAVLDDDPRKQGRAVNGVRILGPLDGLAAVATERRADQALLAIPSADGELVRRAAAAADAAGIELKVLPSVRGLIGGRVSVRDVRDLSIDDLLGRQQVMTDLDAVRRILAGRRVLITGAGGSIGSEIARQVAACHPAGLILLDHDETHLHDTLATVEDATALLADIRDRDLLVDLFTDHRPEVVFHAAAHKHVPILESHPCEAVLTNVLGTENVVEAAQRAGTWRLVCISTDKAVRPESVMGASKWLAEQVVLSRQPAGTAYCAVRFGNVLGSRGSVIPTFMRQIAAGGPVTVTDPRMTRYFMSIPEAVQLVLQAATFAAGGEVFMLEMGTPVRIIDLAERMIRLSGRRVGTDIPIRITGVRPGEKLAEELTAPQECPEPTPHPGIYRLHPPVMAGAVLDDALARLGHLAHDRAGPAVAKELHSLAIGWQDEGAEVRVIHAHGVADPVEVSAWNSSTS